MSPMPSPLARMLRLGGASARRLRPAAGLPLAALFALLVLGAAPAGTPSRFDNTLYRSQLQTARRALAHGQLQAAADMFAQLHAARPREEGAVAGLAEAWIALGHLDDADTLLAGMLPDAADKADLLQLRVKLRRAQKRPEDAFQDIVNTLATDPDRASWAYRETEDMLHDGFAAKSALKIAAEARRAHPADVSFAVLEAVLYDLDGHPDEGLQEILAEENAHALHGRALLLYADELLALQHEDAALAALQGAAEHLDDPVPRSVVLFKVAEIQEGRGEYPQALAALKRVVADRPGTTTAGKALLASADIYQKYMNDPKGALAVYQQLENDPILGHRRPEMLLQMADCYVRLGNFDEAAKTYAEVIPEAVDPEHAETAAYKRAEVEFFRGDIDSALVLYQDMAQTYPRSLLADDAAGRYILLNKYLMVGGGTALPLIGRMEWGLLVGDSAAVDSSAKAVIENWGDGELGAEAYLGLADLAERSGRYPEALGYLDKLVAGHKEDERAPAALMRAGDILAQQLSRPQEALARYETILTDYPNSVQAGDARRLVEKLRRDLKS